MEKASILETYRQNKVTEELTHGVEEERQEFEKIIDKHPTVSTVEELEEALNIEKNNFEKMVDSIRKDAIDG